MARTNNYQKLKSLQEMRKDASDGASAIITRAHREGRTLTTEEISEFERRSHESDRLLAQINTELNASIEDYGRQPAPDHRIAGREDIIDPRSEGYGSRARDTAPVRMTRAARETTTKIFRGIPLSEEEQRTCFSPIGDEQRTLSAVTGASGAYTIPQGFVYNLEFALKYYGGIVGAAGEIPTDDGRILPWPTINDTSNSGEIISENTPVAGAAGGAAEQDPAYGVVSFSAFMQTSGLIKLPIQLVQDSAFNVETYLQEMLETRIGRKLNAKCTTGSGTGEPLGIVNAVTTGITGGSPTVVSYNDLVNIEFSVDRSYREKPSCGWMFHDSTLKAVKKLTDANGRPLFIAGGTAEGIVTNKTPDLLMGYPIHVNNDMPQLGSNQKAILFGAFEKYKIRRVRKIQIFIFRERFMDNLDLAWLAWLRADGRLVDAGTGPIVSYTCSAT